MTIENASRAVNPQMVTLARKSRELTQARLSKMLGVGQGTISKIESGITPATGDQLQGLCHYLDYPESFFLAFEQVDGLGLPEFYHARKRKTVPARVMDRAYAHVTIRRLHIERLLRSYPIDYDQFPLFPSSDWDDPAKIARTVRAQLEVPPGPIFNITAIVERFGAVVVSCDFQSRQIDGFSRWRPASQPPIFFMSRHTPPDRWRWTLAHEFAHVVMHTNHHASDEMEDEANRFAQEILMPEQLIKPHLVNLTFSKLAGLKTYWKVSMQALVFRAYSLKQITDRQRRYLYMQLSTAGYKMREPAELDPPIESPATLNKMLEFHRASLGYDVADLCKMLSLNEPELRSIYNVDSGSGLHVVK